MKGPEPAQPHARDGRSSLRARIGRERRVLRAALVLSAVLHLVVTGILGGLLEAPPEGAPPLRTPLVAEPPSGMRAVNLRAVAANTSPDAVTPPPPVPVRPDPVAPTADLLAEPVARVPADDRTAADRLAPRLVDPRLWRPMVLMPLEPSMDDVRARVAAALELLSDSALADAERQIAATDWTVRDADGERWGISPGVLHLGKLKIPLPIYYVEEWNDRRNQFLEVEAQLDRALFLENFEDRVKKIRERRDRERGERLDGVGGNVAESAGGGGGGGGGGL